MTKTTPAPAPAAAASPVDQLIAAMARLVDDGDRARNIRHLFVSQANGNLQISLDMHQPVER